MKMSWHTVKMVGRQVRMYSLAGSVGPNMTNNPADVMLVQYMLREIAKKLPSKVRPMGTLHVDGVFGPLTHYWGLFFQLLIKAKHPDKEFIELGVFLREGHAQFDEFSASTSEKMIVQLNWYFRSKCPEAPADLADDPNCPAMLRAALRG